MSVIRPHAKGIVFSAILGFAILSQAGLAQAEERNTYDGAGCIGVTDGNNVNLFRTGFSLVASATATVVCPITKTIFNSTAAVEVAVAASGGTVCRLGSTDVFSTGTFTSPFVTWPGTGVTGQTLQIPTSFRGGMRVRCTLQASDSILNILVHEL